jgi:RNA polymerase sigma-70 factor (ECF subfamily)
MLGYAIPILQVRTRSAPTTPDSLTAGSQLGTALRQRREGSIEAVYEEFGRTTFGYLLSTLRDRSAAEDVQQEVFIEVWKRAESYDPERGSLGAWIMTIARSRAIDALRKRVPEPRDPSMTVDLVDSDAEQEGPRAVERWLTGHLLSKIPERERALLRMRFYSDMSQSEIAASTGIPLGTVKMQMVAGLRRLRELLDEEGQ